MVILHAGAQGYLPSKISFLAHKFIQFNRGACACGKIGLLVYPWRTELKSFFFKGIKKTLQTHACKAKCRSGGKIYRAPIFFQETLKKAPPIGQGAWQLFVVFYKSLFAEPFDPFLIHRPSVLLCDSPFYLFAHVVDGAYAVRLFFFHF